MALIDKYHGLLALSHLLFVLSLLLVELSQGLVPPPSHVPAGEDVLEHYSVPADRTLFGQILVADTHKSLVPVQHPG